MRKYIIILLVGLLVAWNGISSATTIYEIQYNTTDPGFTGITCYPSPLMENTVDVVGVVMGVDPGGSGFYIQDADSLWSGIFVYNSDQSVSRGDSVSFTAVVREEGDNFDGYTQLEEISSFQQLSENAQLFDPLNINSGMLSEPCNDSAESYEGMLVGVANVTVTEVADGNGRWKVDDGSGGVFIGNDYYSYNPVVGESLLSITGVVSGFNNGADVNYIILPRNADDLKFASNPRPNISNIAITPSSPTSQDDITISAIITDDSRVESAFVHYGLNDNTVSDSLQMSVEDSTYTGLIPALGDSGWLYYYISATDDSNATTVTSLDSVGILSVINMADIQADPEQWVGEMVTCQGVVTIGIDVIQTGKLNSYFQDNSGRGLNLYSSQTTPDYAAYVKRGVLIRAKGTIDVYQGRTELKDPDITFIDSLQPLPTPQVLTTGQASEQNWDGTLVVVSGDIISIGSESGGGNNVMVDDGSGAVTVRVWTTTGIDVGNLIEGQTYTVVGVGGDYNGTKQIVPGYPEDIYPGNYTPGGIGTATIQPSDVKADQTDLTETITIASDSSITLDIIKIVIPNGWVWENPSESGVEYFGDGIDSSSIVVTIESNSIRLNNTAITSTANAIIRIRGLTSPATPGNYTFQVLTSYGGNALEQIGSSPVVVVEGAKEAYLEIPPKILIPDYGEKLKITYAAPNNSDVLIQIYDIEGTLIATLLDEAYDPTESEVVWNGRDRLKEIVPIGVYICYLEAVEKPSGKITTAKAPIVIGIPLK